MGTAKDEQGWLANPDCSQPLFGSIVNHASVCASDNSLYPRMGDSSRSFQSWSVGESRSTYFAGVDCNKRQAIAPVFGQLSSEPAGIVYSGCAHTLLLSKELCHVALPKGSGVGAASPRCPS